jgi:hypothetical protein
LVGPGPVDASIRVGGDLARLSIRPNRAGMRNSVVLAMRDRSGPIRGAAVRLDFTMLDMLMGRLSFRLSERTPGVYTYSGPALAMRGLWRLSFDARPRSGRRLRIAIDDRVG